MLRVTLGRGEGPGEEAALARGEAVAESTHEGEEPEEERELRPQSARPSARPSAWPLRAFWQAATSRNRTGGRPLASSSSIDPLKTIVAPAESAVGKGAAKGRWRTL